MRVTSRTLRSAISDISSDTLRRAYQYVPSVPRMLAKSLSFQADTIIFDLEDSVADADKPTARNTLSKFLSDETTARAIPSSKIAVRINSTSTPFWRDDVLAALSSPIVSTLVVPKVHSVDMLDQIEQVAGVVNRPVSIVASIESARGLWDIGSIAGWKSRLPDSRLRMDALLFAAEDYCADTRVQRTPSGEELLYPRSHIVVAARAFGLSSIDMVCVDYKDEEKLRNECLSGRRLGFSGKQAIHPSQVQAIQALFGPSRQELQRAVDIVEGMRLANASNRGAFGLSSASGETEMIDAPMVKQARNILGQALAAGMPIPEPSTSSAPSSSSQER